MSTLEHLRASLSALRQRRGVLTLKLQKIEAGIAGIEAILEDEGFDDEIEDAVVGEQQAPKIIDFVKATLAESPNQKVVEITRSVMKAIGSDNEKSVQSRVSRALNENLDVVFAKGEDRRWSLL